MSLREEARRFKSRLKTEIKSILGHGSPSAPEVATAMEHTPSPPSQAPAETVPNPEAELVSWTKLEGWTNLKTCLDTFSQVAGASGLGPLKTMIEGLVDCAGAFEDAAHGRRAYTELRSELEDIFRELQQYLTASPAVANNVSDICGLIENEINHVKSRQARPTVRRLAEAEQDEDDILECYRRIRNHLQGLSRKMGVSTLAIVERHAMDDRMEKLAPALSARYNTGSASRLKRGPCTQGTRVHLLSDMHQWTAGKDTGSIYWMSGMAGTGKTTIAYSLCERLDVEPNRMLGASFFCSRLLPECRNVGKIIPSIAYQLAQRSQPFYHALCRAMQEYPEALDVVPSVQFESLLVAPLSDPKVQVGLPAGIVVVIDALDECDDVTSTQQILDALLTKSKGLPIKFVVSSRPETAIRNQMERSGSWIDARVVLHELDGGEVQTDIRTYLEAELAPIGPSEADIKALVNRAGVLFIYAATVVRYVGRDNFQRNPRARLRTLLDTSKQQSKVQTEDIDQLYALILESATTDKHLEESEREDMKLVLHTVVCAKAPLTVAALNALLKLDDIERVNAALRPLWSVLHVMGQEMTVTTLHASFPDYLMDPSRSGDSMWHCDATAHHTMLAQRCFECIRGTTPQFNICQLESSYLNDNEVKDLDMRVKTFIPVELRYVCRYWPVHLCASGSSAEPPLINLFEKFLTNNLLLWLEIINLTRDVFVSPSELTNVSGWATQHDANRGLISLVQDAWRFATTIVSSPVGQSTPHIYVSMLPFLPPHSPIREHYGDRMHGMIGVEGTARDGRTGRLGGWSFKPSECAAFSSDCTLVAIVQAYSKGFLLLDVSSGRLVRNESLQ
ncbi:unnamed protein product [Rhizoctonia solani]|uniref:Nephrocystin 3-like N-terminal domain-containing protein n=1 Tax=Rhizoctonia solani TaxID=456999 RepID=A0A8H3HYK7_9AGAM|nr:unnamed protein product [Rhizoctonia solani]